MIAAGFDSGGPTHKKLEPTALTSPPRSTTATAVAESGQLSAPPQSQPGQQYAPPVQQHAAPVQHSPQPSNGYTAVPPASTGYQPHSTQGNSGLPPVSRPNPGNGYPASPERHGSLPSRAVPLPEDPDDEVDVPPFMRR